MFLFKLPWTVLGMLAALLALLVGQLGCSTPKTADELALFTGTLQAQVQAMQEAGIEAWAVAHVRHHMIGALSTSLEGPLDVDVFLFAKAQPAPAADAPSAAAAP